MTGNARVGARPSIAIVLLGACSAAPAPLPQARAHDFEVITLPGAPPGLSDLTLDESGALWSIAERDRALVRIELTSHAAAITVVPIDGVPDGVDTEGLAWLGGGKLAISTEGQDVATAAVLSAEIRGGRAVVTGSRELTNETVGVALRSNHGAEALCGKAGDLLVGIESVGLLADGTRYAPLVRLRGDQTSVVKFRLTSRQGKLSALSCTLSPGGAVRGLAIERHFGVSRILEFELGPDAKEVTPRIALDITTVVHDALNLEGIVALPDGRVVIVNDNQSSRIEGPTELLVFPPLGAH